MNTERIFLIGMPGCGKSREGKKLAKLLQWDFVDLDVLIEKKTGYSIQEFFDQKGEQTFRLLEQVVLIETFDLLNTVIACGGGTPAFKNNMQRINQQGLSIYLKANPAFLLSRISSENNHRPLFSGLNEEQLLEKITQLWVEREPFYFQASTCLELPLKSAKSVYHKVLEALQND